MSTIPVPEPRLRGFVHDALRALGVPETQALTVTDTLVDADLRGVDSHGANLIKLYVDRFASGAINPVTEITTVRDDGSTVVLDGGLGLGQVGGRRAIDLGMERAAAHGVATIAVRESTHLGALGYYTRAAARAGYVALVVQNGPTIVPPFGGVDQVFSTNPFSYGLPTDRHPPVVYDVATTAAAGNKLLLAKKRGDATIPPGWARDERGRPTTDTERASVHHLEWMAGHKGFGLAFFVEALSGVLAGGPFGHQERTASPFHGKERVAKGYVFIVIDVARFGSRGQFRADMDQLIDDVHASAPAEDATEVLVPGELEERRHQQRSRDGVPFAEGLVDELDVVADRLGIDRLVSPG